MNVHTKGEFGGIGIEISSEMSVTKVVSAIDDTPAFKAGINSGDYIIRIDDISTQGLRIDEVVKKIRGKPNTSVKLTIYRKGEAVPLEKIIVRKIIKINPVKSNLFKDVAYIKINSFSEKTTEGIIREFANIQKKLDKNISLKGLVLDLRNNPGGLLDQSAEVADLFLPKNAKIVSIKGRDQSKIIEFIDDKPETLFPNLPIAVLINEGSASASEIVAGALQDNKRAVIMGSKSFGKGSVQSLIALSDNSSAIKLTTALYYTPSGRSIQASGIEPDIELESATIEKSKQILPKDSEADLKGHLEVEINQNLNKTAKQQDKKITDNNLEIYQKDYQLGRAIDLIRGVSLSKAIFNGS
jgi:carboxyl-terminal processing protease